MPKRSIATLALLVTSFFLATPSGSQQQRSARLEPIAVIQEVPGYDFYAPVSIATDSGLVFIADFRDCCIHVFDEKLVHKAVIGAPGDGPGEFRQLVSIDARGGVLAALNLYPPHVTLFDYTGRMLDRWEVTASPWGDLRLTPQGTLLLVHSDRSSGAFLTEMSLEGGVVAEHMQDPFPHPIGTASEARLLLGDDEIYIVLTQLPRIIGRGQREFDWSYDYARLDPGLRTHFHNREQLLRERPEGLWRFPVQGGGAVAGDHLVLGGYNFNLLVLDATSGDISYVTLGPLAGELVTEFRPRSGGPPMSQATYRDAVAVRDEIWFLAGGGFYLIKFRTADILAAASGGTILKPKK